MKRITSYFLQGLLYIGPISLTIYVIYWVFTFTDSLLKSFLYKFFDIQIPGIGVLVLIIVITFLGYLGQTIIAKPFKLVLTRFILRIPLLNLIYSSLNDFFSAVVGKDKRFNKPVKVRMNSNEGIYRLGFVTNENLNTLSEKKIVAVYFPFSYTFTGETFLVEEHFIEPINLSAAEVMKFLMAGGIPDIEPQLSHKSSE
jgi:uncharacterized membrane protein